MATAASSTAQRKRGANPVLENSFVTDVRLKRSDKCTQMSVDRRSAYVRMRAAPYAIIRRRTQDADAYFHLARRTTSGPITARNNTYAAERGPSAGSAAAPKPAMTME